MGLISADYLSVGGFHADGVKIHQALLKADNWIIEGLNQKQVPTGRVQLVWLRVKIFEGDGAPARALARPVDGPGRGRR